MEQIENYLITKNKKLEKENKQLKRLLQIIERRFGFQLRNVDYINLKSIALKKDFFYETDGKKDFETLVKYFEIKEEE